MNKLALLCAAAALALGSMLAHAAEPRGTINAWIGASSGDVANASAAASMAAANGVTNVLAGFQITAGGATAASCVVATVTGLIGGTLSYDVCPPAGVTLQATPLIVEFNTPIPASSVGVAITVTLPALGAGNAHAAANLHGYQLQ